jgi:hypothetical protein
MPCQNARVARTVLLETETPFSSAFLKLSLIRQCLAWGGSLNSSAEARLEPGRQANQSWPVLRWRGLSCLLVLFCLVHCHHAHGQVPFPSIRLAPRTAVFGEFTDIKPNFRVNTDYAVWGFTVGGYVQTPHVLGFELRGSVTRWGGAEHQQAVLFGPRAVLHIRRFSPYVAVLGGAANTWSWRDPKNLRLWVDEKVSPDLTILGGIDVHMSHRISLRVGEASYSRVFRSDRTLNTLGASAGLVYRLPW